MKLDTSKLENQDYLLKELLRLNSESNGILDISDYSQEDKKKVIDAYKKLTFTLAQSNTKPQFSILTEVIKESKPEPVQEKPKTKSKK